MSLLALYEGMEKTASQNNYHQNDEWSETAAQYGMTTDEFMDKLAEQQVLEEVELVKQAQEATWLGKCMGSGYVDTLVKVATANPVYDEIPEIHIKVAQESLNGLVSHMVKAANVGSRAEQILMNLAQATGMGRRGKLLREASDVMRSKPDFLSLGIRESVLPTLGTRGSKLTKIRQELGGGMAPKGFMDIKGGLKEVFSLNPNKPLQQMASKGRGEALVDALKAAVGR